MTPGYGRLVCRTPRQAECQHALWLCGSYLDLARIKLRAGPVEVPTGFSDGLVAPAPSPHSAGPFMEPFGVPTGSGAFAFGSLNEPGSDLALSFGPTPEKVDRLVSMFGCVAMTVCWATDCGAFGCCPRHRFTTACLRGVNSEERRADAEDALRRSTGDMAAATDIMLGQ